MKKQLTAVALATMVSSSVFAACSANINMGGKNILNVGGTGEDYSVATKADLYAGSRLAASSISNDTVSGLGAAARYCASLDDDGSSTTSGDGNWRLPANLAEASVAITGDTADSDITSTNYIWTADALNKADQAPNEDWSTTGDGRYLIMKLDGHWSYGTYTAAHLYAGCVR
jgi:hypothetical protein